MISIALADSETSVKFSAVVTLTDFDLSEIKRPPDMNAVPALDCLTQMAFTATAPAQRSHYRPDAALGPPLIRLIVAWRKAVASGDLV